MQIESNFLRELWKQVQLHPDKIALEAERSITYSDLWNESNKLSLALNKKNFGEVIAVSLPPSIEYIVSILGIWISGRAFAPIETNLPESRKMEYYKKISPDLILDSKEKFYSLLGNIPIDSQRELTLEPKKDRLAYIIFTSGSTGSPKAVMVEEKGIWNFLKTQIEYFSTNHKTRTLQNLSIGFDASISEIGVTLLSGGTLVIPNSTKELSINKLLNLIHKKKITHICLAPAILRFLVNEKLPECLETIIIGGEVAKLEYIKEISKQLKLVSVYGPTEMTVCTHLAICDSNWLEGYIGEPVSGMIEKVFDENLQEISEGVGELYLSGIQVARGYYQDAKLTRSKFIEHDNEIFYRTGDKVQISNGKLIFLGRIDRQFKINGNLIEPYEVERFLEKEFPILKSNLTKENFGANTNLVCYIEPKENIPIHLEEIIERLKKVFPSWMIPQKFYLYGSSLINQNGKTEFNEFSGIDKKLALAWKEVFGKEPKSLEEDFFKNGGDSLSAIHFISILDKHNISLSYDELLSNSTIFELNNRFVEKLKYKVASPELSAGESTFSNLFYNKSNMIHNKKAKIGYSKKFLLNESKIPLLTTPKLKSIQLKKILVTGGTGNLGTEFLKKLSQKDVQIFALSRKKLESKNNIQWLEADLSEPKFGLSDSVYSMLENEIDIIYHFAADHNLIQSYQNLKNANVLTTKNLLKFSFSNKLKFFSYVSTLSIFPTSDTKERLIEEKRFSEFRRIYSGYDATKFVSEEILLNGYHYFPNYLKIFRPSLLFSLESILNMNQFSQLREFFSNIEESDLVDEDVLNLELNLVSLEKVSNLILQKSFSCEEKTIYHISRKNISLRTILNLLPNLPKQKKIHKSSYVYTSLLRVYDPNAYKKFSGIGLFQATDFDFKIKLTS
ncbi:MAG: AMP-binding protein [Leptospiraceae bacterium]|nr:AMP-binding protein [Leptospiraceae bacterium]